jgi:hypothetical protein
MIVLRLDRKKRVYATEFLELLVTRSRTISYGGIANPRPRIRTAAKAENALDDVPFGAPFVRRPRL